MLRTTRKFIHDFSALARPYWVSDERWTGRTLLAAIVGMNLGIVYFNVLLSEWNNRFYNALDNREFGTFSHELGVFCMLAAAYIVMAVYQTYLNQMLLIRWRRWLTEHTLEQWMAEKAYYHLQLGDYGADNPDQRIADDLRLFIDGALTLSLGLLTSVATLASFSFILWRLSGSLEFTIGGTHWAIPGYMLWAALLYAIGGTWLTHRIGSPLMPLNFQQQRVEADLRYSLVRLRENTEGAALYNGERDESRGLMERFGDIATNWWAIMKRQKRVTWFTAGYGQAAVVFPILAAAPRYFTGAIQLGGLMQTAQAFGQVQGALSWFVTTYISIAQWFATIDRLTGFRTAIEASKARTAAAGISRVQYDGEAIVLRDVTLYLPDGEPLSTGLDAQLRKGESVLLTGPSGAGKSTLLRAIAGIWPFGHGRIEVPANARLLFLPQKPYLQVDSLRRVLCYPSIDQCDDAAIHDALTACNLAELAPRLDESQNWAIQLSPGEQQRIALARALLQKPEWLFLDEATSAVDEKGEAALYQVLKERLPGTTLVSVGHRSTLRQFHDAQLELRPDRNGMARLAGAHPRLVATARGPG